MGIYGVASGARSRQACWRSATITAIAAAVLASLWSTALPATAQARSCSRAEQAQLRKANTIVLELNRGNRDGRVEAAAVLKRAKSQCTTARFAVAVAQLTRRHGAAVDKRAYSLNGVFFRGVGERFRFDARTNVSVWRKSGSSATRRLRRMRQYLVVGRSGTWWAGDPTRVSKDANMQIDLAATLAQSRTAAARQLAASTLGVVSGRERSIRRLPLFEFLPRAERVARVAAVTRDRRAMRLQTRLVAQTLSRAKAADAGSWTRVNRRDATLDEHRLLVQHLSAIARHSRNPAVRSRAARFDAYMRTPPDVRFLRVPVGRFYPVPADGIKDTQALHLVTSKPGSIVVNVYDGTGNVIAAITANVRAGEWQGAWNGMNAGGRHVAVGSYRYSVTAADLAGNRRLLPGLGTFNVARDTTAPVIQSASLKHMGGVSRRQLQVAWNVAETESPRMRIRLVITGNGTRKVLTLPGTARRGSVRLNTRLPRGTYRTTLQVYDGAGNGSARRTAVLRFSR